MPMERGYGLHEDELVVTCYMDFHLVVHYFGWVVDVVEKYSDYYLPSSMRCLQDCRSLALTVPSGLEVPPTAHRHQK